MRVQDFPKVVKRNKRKKFNYKKFFVGFLRLAGILLSAASIFFVFPGVMLLPREQVALGIPVGLIAMLLILLSYGVEEYFVRNKKTLSKKEEMTAHWKMAR